MKGVSILLVEDARNLRQVISTCLGQLGAVVETVASISDARRHLTRNPPRLVMVDIDNQRDDALSFLSELDSLGLETIVVSERTDSNDRIQYLERGVLDIVPKPIDLRELSLRIARFWRPKRGSALPAHIETVCGKAVLDVTTRTLRNARHKPVPLTASEFRLLYLLIQNEGRVVERTEITRAVLGQGQDSMSRSIDVMISKLRRKLDEIGSERFIRSVRSEGYLLIGDERKIARGTSAADAQNDQDLVGTEQ